MGKDPSSFSTSEIGAEILIYVATSFMAVAAILLTYSEFGRRTFWVKNDKRTSLYLSSAFKLFLPLLSYMDLQAQQHDAYDRAQIILVWTVLAELIHMSIDLIHPWQLWDSIEQCIRIAWAGYLVFGSNGGSHVVRITLLVICSVAFIYEIYQAVTLYLAESSLRLGKNPQLVDLYMKQIMEEDDTEVPAPVAPMASCKYVVFGEETQKIAFRHSTYLVDRSNSRLDNLITVGQVYQPKPEDEAFTSRYPHWRKICVSFALAKLLRRRFAQLPLAEAGSRQALEFVKMGLIGSHHGNNEDHMNEQRRNRNARSRSVFYIIQKELFFLSDLLRTKVSTCYLNFLPYEIFASMIALGNIIIVTSIYGRDMVDRKYYRSFFLNFNNRNSVVYIMSTIDLCITGFLVVACNYLQLKWLYRYFSSHWKNMGKFRGYLENPTKWDCVSKKRSKLKKSKGVHRAQDARSLENLHSVLDVKYSSCIKRSRNIRQLVTGAVQHVDVQKALLRSFEMSGGKLTNGESSLIRHGVIEHLSWACQPSQSNTETILVWHIATTLFHDHKSPQMIDSHLRVAITLSSYCEYLVRYLPELLPDVVDWTKSALKRVEEEVSGANPSEHKSRKKFCGKIRDEPWKDDSVVGKGVRLVKDLEEMAIERRDDKQVWEILADFWAEMMLYVAPSDNLKGHENILNNGELITQLWALLTHAGIIARPEIPDHCDYRAGSTAV